MSETTFDEVVKMALAPPATMPVITETVNSIYDALVSYGPDDLGRLMSVVDVQASARLAAQMRRNLADYEAAIARLENLLWAQSPAPKAAE